MKLKLTLNELEERGKCFIVINYQLSLIAMQRKHLLVSFIIRLACEWDRFQLLGILYQFRFNCCLHIRLIIIMQ